MLETCEHTNIPVIWGYIPEKQKTWLHHCKTLKTLYLDGRSKLLKDTASITISI
jgi:hypothetical protein